MTRWTHAPINTEDHRTLTRDGHPIATIHFEPDIADPAAAATEIVAALNDDYRGRWQFAVEQLMQQGGG